MNATSVHLGRITVSFCLKLGKNCTTSDNVHTKPKTSLTGKENQYYCRSHIHDIRTVNVLFIPDDKFNIHHTLVNNVRYDVKKG